MNEAGRMKNEEFKNFAERLNRFPADFFILHSSFFIG
jgi:hypothetical protein